MQNFNKNKKKLMREINNNFSIRKNLFAYTYKKNFVERYKKILLLFFEFPKNNLSYFFYLIQKKIRYLI